MSSNLAIDDNLLEITMKISKHKTKKAVVTEALQEYIQRRNQFQITKLFGTIDYAEDDDYKERRNRNAL